MLRQIDASAGQKPYVAHGRALCVGRDIVVVLGGGAAHVGAVAVAQRPANAEPIVSLITLPGHREGLVARSAAERLALALDRSVVVSAGMHWDDISAPAIAQVVANCYQVVTQLIEQLSPLCSVADPRV